MHMTDALVAPAVAGTMYACSIAALGLSVRRVRLEEEQKKIPVMGVMGAFVFAAQMINFTIPGTGSSGHLCGGMLLSALLGPSAGFLTLCCVLLVQCFLFADGGLLALGCNIWNMAFYGCFVGGMLIWRQMMKRGMSRKKILAASLLGSILTLQLGAFSITLQTLASGITELPFMVFLSVMQPIHLAIGIVEGLITAAVLLFLYEARPELLWGYQEFARETVGGKLTFRKTIVIIAVAAVILSGGISLLASSDPDGLEWSMKQVFGAAEIKPSGFPLYQAAQKLQEKTALLPDYAWKNSHSIFETSFSGIVGVFVVLILCAGCCYLLRFVRRKRDRGSDGG